MEYKSTNGPIAVERGAAGGMIRCAKRLMQGCGQADMEVGILIWYGFPGCFSFALSCPFHALLTCTASGSC